VKAPGDSITSPHSILGAGGVSNTWKRLRGICRPFFNQGEFEEANDRLVEHIIKSVEHALENSPKGGVDLFQLVNRLVVEAHLLAMLGVDSVEAEGKDIPARDYIDSDKISSKCMADIIDDSLNVKMAEPKFSSVAFAPMMTWLTERLMLPADQLGGIENILAQAQKNGELSTMERLHNCIMYMIALAPSPASFWTILHVYKEQEYLKQIREESDDGKFATLAMCVKETLRMYAPVPIMVTRYFRTSDSNKKCPSSLLTGHDKVDLKDGDRVLIPTIILHNDPHLWKNPNKYDPNRFEAPENLTLVGRKATALLLKGSGVQPRPRAKSVRSSKSKARYFPFGQGKHTCLGQPYASWLTMTISSTILSNFDMEIEDVDGLLDLECSYQRIKDHVYTFPKSQFKATITALKDADTNRESIETRKVNFRNSMMTNMQNFSQFFQDRDDDSDDDESDGEDYTLRSRGGKHSISTKGSIEEGDDEEEDW
jgi:cytochrome P450